MNTKIVPWSDAAQQGLEPHRSGPAVVQGAAAEQRHQTAP